MNWKTLDVLLNIADILETLIDFFPRVSPTLMKMHNQTLIKQLCGFLPEAGSVMVHTRHAFSSLLPDQETQE